MATKPVSPLSICRREHLPNHYQTNNTRIKYQQSCNCCCCINYNFFTLGLRYALTSENFGLALTPELIACYLDLNGQSIEQENRKKGQNYAEEASLSANAERSIVKTGLFDQTTTRIGNHTEKTNSLIRAESNRKSRAEQQIVSNQNQQNIDQNNQCRILKINNLGEQSQMNSSPIENINNEEEIPYTANLDKIEQDLKLGEIDRVKQEKPDNQHNSQELEHPIPFQSQPINQNLSDSSPNSLQIAVAASKQQSSESEEQSRQQESSRSQDYNQSDEESNMVQKQEQANVENSKLEQNELVESIYQEQMPQHIGQYSIELQEAKNQQRSDQFYITTPIKQEILEKIHKNNRQEQPQNNYNPQNQNQHSNSLNDQPQSDAIYPYSQPQHHILDPQLISSRQIYSLHQNFQYNHEQIQAQKSRKSRYSKKLDQQLQSEQRKQHTEIQSLNQKIEKLQYNSQSNVGNPHKMYESERQSAPLPESCLKREQDERDAERERQLSEEFSLPKLLNYQSPSEMEQVQYQNLRLDADSDLEKKQQEQDHYSGDLFSDESEQESPQDDHLPGQQDILKKQEENRQQQDSAYAVISIEQQIKRQTFNSSGEIKKREEPEVPIQHNSQQRQIDVAEYIGDLSNIKKEIEENVPLQQVDYHEEVGVNIVYKAEEKEKSEQDVSQDDQSQAQDQRETSQIKRVVSEPEEQQSQLEIPANVSNPEKEKYKEQREQVQDLSQDEDEEEKQSQRESQKSTEKRKNAPRISKKMAIQLKKQSKQQRRSQDQNQSEPQKHLHLTISKTIELNIHKSHTLNNNNLKQQQQQEQQQAKPLKSKIQIANQFSFYQSGSSVRSQKKEKKKKTEYIRKEDYDPQKYEEIQQVIYKVARKSKPKHKKKVREQIYEVPVRKGSTKKLAREYARKKYQSRKEKYLPSQSQSQIEQIEQIEQIYVSQSNQQSNSQSQIFDFPKPPPHRSKRHKSKIKYVYVDQPAHSSRKKSKHTRIVDEQQSISSQNSSEMRTKKKHSYRKH